MVARTLITTADERTWPKDKNEPVLFLGRWCCRYSRREIWQQMDAMVVPYHWDERKKLHADYDDLQSLYEKLLLEVSKQLNQLHNTNHGLRYWRILIGPWLGFFTQILFDRWYMLHQALEEYNVSKVFVIKREQDYSVVPNDMADFHEFFASDDWNEAIYAQLLAWCLSDRVEIIKLKEESQQQTTVISSKKRQTAWLKNAVASITQSFYGFLSKNDKFFFISTYLPLKTNLKLQVSLGQIPKFWRSPTTPNSNAEPNAREWRLTTGHQAATNFPTVIRSFIPHHIPPAYLEGYQSVIAVPQSLGWPVSPSLIFSSNAYSSNDIFKAWTAEKTEQGAQLVIGQHGGHFGMTPFASHEEHQFRIADRWISWGWSEFTQPHITPVGNLKVMGKRRINHNPAGDALMIEMAIPRYSNHLYALPISTQWLDYFREQKRFLEVLPESLRKRVILRIFNSDFGWDQLARWRDTSLGVQLDSGEKSIWPLIRKSRLCISTYNATTYLESFSWNIPTIIFWNPNHWELKEEAMPFFDQLRTAGVFHKTPESAARQMIKVWDNVDAWWGSGSVQTARKEFCNQFTRTPEYPLRALRTLFKKTAT